ncbi:hypothetical protein N7495_002703 [Penicillium taxi]|uniref:uncharacterized protein n=1 Tax=Penicillium taxi TaxID=168475 RepID=UPI002545403E|nr:uncharacterized protein N7495_002703 [Penicillium taxi]KAJ5902175.1 hypothetical protein N7495_002703 [Penicillium taxi]
MVQKPREEVGKRRTSVYGVATDTSTFHFIKLDEKSVFWVIPVGPADGKKGKYSKILRILVYMIRKAATTSPTHSKESTGNNDDGPISLDDMQNADIKAILKRKR